MAERDAFWIVWRNLTWYGRTIYRADRNDPWRSGLRLATSEMRGIPHHIEDFAQGASRYRIDDIIIIIVLNIIQSAYDGVYMCSMYSGSRPLAICSGYNTFDCRVFSTQTIAAIKFIPSSSSTRYRRGHLTVCTDTKGCIIFLTVTAVSYRQIVYRMTL